MSKREKAFTIVSLCSNILLFGLVLGTFIWGWFAAEGELTSKGIGSLKFFATLSNLLVGIAALPMAVVNIISLKQNKVKTNMFAFILKFVAVSAVFLTLLTVLAFLAPLKASAGHSYFGLFKNSNIIYHFAAPVLAILVFVIFEIQAILKFRFTFLGIVPTVLYGVFYILNYHYHWVGDKLEGHGDYDWYGFVSDKFPFWVSALLVLLASYGLAVLLWALNSLSRRKLMAKEEPVLQENIESVPSSSEEEEYIEEEKAVEAPEEEPVKEEEKEEKVPSKTQPAKATPSSYKGGARTYHISKSKDQWQVKLANGEKAIKVFPTQKEAIEFAKELTKTQGGSIRIHSVKGKIRK